MHQCPWKRYISISIICLQSWAKTCSNRILVASVICSITLYPYTQNISSFFERQSATWSLTQCLKRPCCKCSFSALPHADTSSALQEPTTGTALATAMCYSIYPTLQDEAVAQRLLSIRSSRQLSAKCPPKRLFSLCSPSRHSTISQVQINTQSHTAHSLILAPRCAFKECASNSWSTSCHRGIREGSMLWEAMRF